MDKIVFVCTGNTCRSPMAEGIFRALGGEKKTGLVAASAGVFTVDDLPASAHAVTAAAEHGAEPDVHRSRMLTAEIVEDARYLVCMTGAHYDRVLEAFPQAEGKVFTLMELDVSDPFGGDLDTYRGCAAALQKGIAALIEGLDKA